MKYHVMGHITANFTDGRTSKSVKITMIETADADTAEDAITAVAATASKLWGSYDIDATGLTATPADATEPTQPIPEPKAPEPPTHELHADWNEIDFNALRPHMHMIRVLADAGYETPRSVREATDKELLDINGIGPKSLAVLRTVIGQELATKEAFTNVRS